MTDEELLSQYGGYSDDQLVEYIAQGIPDWQREEFQRLLRLRRRAHYKDIVGIPSGPPKLPGRDSKAAIKTQKSSTDSPAVRDNETESTLNELTKPRKLSGCGCVIVLIIAASLIFVIINH